MITAKYDGNSNEGQIVSLLDGTQYRFVWSGIICEVSKSLKSRERNGTMNMRLSCHTCGMYLGVLGTSYYNRRGRNRNAKSRIYCLDCAERFGLIETLRKRVLLTTKEPEQ